MFTNAERSDLFLKWFEKLFNMKIKEGKPILVACQESLAVLGCVGLRQHLHSTLGPYYEIARTIDAYVDGHGDVGRVAPTAWHLEAAMQLAAAHRAPHH